ncbi:MAG: DNA/RNA nuclease SfsA [Candidatus Bathyarchaeota archaeon]|jgi:sugar fermentation stimulation protein A|nr:DNA/RNA nuclease SfsA [Candidatus Bathyarchaeota archaeon]
MTVLIKIEGEILEGIFKERLTRFLALVERENKVFEVFLPNPGRLKELLNFGAKVVLKKTVPKGRKTAYDLIGVYLDGEKVSVDSRVPNRLVFEALKKKALKEFAEYSLIKPEPLYGHTRFDFLLSNHKEVCLLEVKSCTLVRDGIAMFPDAKTERGKRHVMELLKAKREGYRACILFIIQRTDAHSFSPADDVDKEFGEALRQAFNGGVEVYAYSSKFVEDRIVLDGRVKVKL